MASRGRHKPAHAPSVDDLHNDSVHVPRAYGDDELPFSDGPDSVEEPVPAVEDVGEVAVPAVEDPDAKSEPGPELERPEWSTAGVLNDPNVRVVTPCFPCGYSHCCCRLTC